MPKGYYYRSPCNTPSEVTVTTLGPQLGLNWTSLYFLLFFLSLLAFPLQPPLSLVLYTLLCALRSSSLSPPASPSFALSETHLPTTVKVCSVSRYGRVWFLQGTIKSSSTAPGLFKLSQKALVPVLKCFKAALSTCVWCLLPLAGVYCCGCG